jgi:biopolymer transport protein ExbD
MTDAGPRPLVIEVARAEGRTRVVVAERELSPDALEAVVRDAAGADQSRAVEVRAARDLAYADLAPVLRACRAAGLTSVRLAAEKHQ